VLFSDNVDVTAIRGAEPSAPGSSCRVRPHQARERLKHGWSVCVRAHTCAGYGLKRCAARCVYPYAHRTRLEDRRSRRRGKAGPTGRRAWRRGRFVKRTTRRNWDGGRYDRMRDLLATDRGGELDRKRQPMIEPVFAQMKFNRGLDRFKRRGRGAVRTEWRLITATHNLLKLHRHATAAA
jgi:hypothetical protein